jgi:multidrug resistance efflux pump
VPGKRHRLKSVTRVKVVGLAVAAALVVGLVFIVERARLAQVPHNPAPRQSVPAAPKELTLQGRVEAVHSIPVSVAIAGEIDSFSAEVGQDVFEGQILARVSNQGLQTGLDNSQRILQNAETKLNTLETTISAARLEAVRAHTESIRASEDRDHAGKIFERERMLNEAGATPRKTFEKSQKDYESAASESEGLGELARHADEHVDALTKEYDLTKKTLEDKRKELEEAQTAVAAAEIRAPAGGIVVARQGEIGKTITQEEASALFRIATDISAMRVMFTPDPGMKPGDPINITFTDVPGDPISAAIREIKNGLATAEFTSANPAIRPGMSCTVHAKIK